jgi:hypothetical protein
MRSPIVKVWPAGRRPESTQYCSLSKFTVWSSSRRLQTNAVRPAAPLGNAGGQRHLLVKPTFGIRMCSGVCPPSKNGLPEANSVNAGQTRANLKESAHLIPPLDRDFWPLWPRPQVLPFPDPMPRPRRFDCQPTNTRERRQRLYRAELVVPGRSGAHILVSPLVGSNGVERERFAMRESCGRWLVRAHKGCHGGGSGRGQGCTSQGAQHRSIRQPGFFNSSAWCGRCFRVLCGSTPYVTIDHYSVQWPGFRGTRAAQCRVW